MDLDGYVVLQLTEEPLTTNVVVVSLQWGALCKIISPCSPLSPMVKGETEEVLGPKLCSNAEFSLELFRVRKTLIQEEQSLSITALGTVKP